MAQMDAGEKPKETMRDSSSSPSFKLNPQAPEFIPRSQTQMPISSYICPYAPFYGGRVGSDWFYVGDQDQFQLYASPNVVHPSYSMNCLTGDLQNKIIKQVEYQFSDMSLLANESLARHISKDREGYVPISVVSNSKKIKNLVTNTHLLVQALRASSKIVVSNDGKRVKRKHVFTDRDKEELQSRTVVAENLPGDYSHHNLEKIFNVVGSVKSIRICHPQESSSSRAKSEYNISNKLHALVEYATTEMANKAAEKLNDERNWREGLRVRLLLRCSPKSVLKNKKSEFNVLVDDDDGELLPESLENSPRCPNNLDSPSDNTGDENGIGAKKGWGRSRGKAKGRGQSHGARGLLPTSPSSSFSSSNNNSPKGPKMPDGSKGFPMGRGKPIVSME